MTKILIDKETVELALESLELAGGNLCEALHHPKKLQHEIGQPCPAVAKYDNAITALRQALAVAEQHKQPTEQEAAPRKPLMDEEILNVNMSTVTKLIDEPIICDTDHNIIQFARAIESAHGITGENE